jgi:hypothetical protein
MSQLVMPMPLSEESSASMSLAWISRRGTTKKHQARGLSLKIWHTIWEFHIVNIHGTDVMEASCVSMLDKALPGAPIVWGSLLIHQFKIFYMFRFRSANLLPTCAQRRR